MRRKKKAQAEAVAIPRKAKLAMIAAGCAALVLAGLVYGGYSLKSWVMSLDVFKVSKAVIADAPDWLPSGVRGDLLRFCPVKERKSIFDAKILKDIKASYLVNGWVKEVEWVRKRFPDTVQCRLQLRRPLAAVEMKRFYLVDREGVRLPGAYDRWPDGGFDLPVIKGVGGTVPAVEQGWSDKSLPAAIRVLCEIGAVEGLERVRVKAVDVSNFGGRISRNESEIVIVTAEGTSILWGRTPGTQTLGERASSAKLAELAKIVKEDSLAKYQYIDLRFEPSVRSYR